MQHYNQGYDELYHYGIKGMKWGVRRAVDQFKKSMKDTSSVIKKSNEIRKQKNDRYRLSTQDQYADGKINTNYDKTQRLKDDKLLGSRGVRNVSKMMDHGMSHKAARRIEIGKQVAFGAALSLAALDVASDGDLHRAGIAAVKKHMAGKEARKKIIKIAQNKYFDPIDVAYKIL